MTEELYGLSPGLLCLKLAEQDNKERIKDLHEMAAKKELLKESNGSTKE